MAYKINNSNSKEKKSKTNFSTIDKSRNNKYKIDINSSIDNISGEENNSDEERNNNIIEAKAKKYLNDLYKKNFNGNDIIPNSNFINKNISLYEELFSKPVNKNYIYTETGYNDVSSPKRKGGVSLNKRNRSTGNRKKMYIESFYDDKTINDINFERGVLAYEKRKKNIRNNLTHHYNKHKKNTKSVSNNDYNKKNRKKAISFVKRSPYLLNKF